MRSTEGPLFEFLAKLVQDKWKRFKLITCFVFSQTYLSNSEVGRPDSFRPEKNFNHDRCVLLYLWSVWVYWELVLKRVHEDSIKMEVEFQCLRKSFFSLIQTFVYTFLLIICVF